MKDSGHPRDPRMGGEFGPQLVLQETGKSRQGPSEDHSAFLQSGGNDLGLRSFESGAEIVNLGRDGSNASSLQFRRGLEEHPLPFHLLFHERGDESEFLHALDLDPRSAFDRDVQVLADGPDPAHHLPRRTKEGAEGEGDFPRLFGRLDVRARRDLDERNSEPVQAIDHLALRLAQLPRGVFFQLDGRYPNSLSVRLEVSIQGDEGESLETRAVGGSPIRPSGRGPDSPWDWESKARD